MRWKILISSVILCHSVRKISISEWKAGHIGADPGYRQKTEFLDFLHQNGVFKVWGPGAEWNVCLCWSPGSSLAEISSNLMLWPHECTKPSSCCRVGPPGWRPEPLTWWMKGVAVHAGILWHDENMLFNYHTNHLWWIRPEREPLSIKTGQKR